MTTKMLDGPGWDIPVHSPICSTCRHLDWGATRACAAFPGMDSIPLEIWLGHNDHRTPVPGDHGIQYERITPDEARHRYEERRAAAGPRPEVPRRPRPARRTA